MSRDLCPCRFCETDREKGRGQYVARWADGQYFTASGAAYFASREQAGIFGVRHAAWFGSHLTPVLVPGEYRDPLTIDECRASKDPATMPAVF